jgi:cyclin A
MRVTRQAAAKQRQAEVQHGLQHKTGRHQTPTVAFEDAMAVDAGSAQGDELPRDAQQCSYLVREVYDYLRAREMRHRVKPHFLATQLDINCSMRGILVDWLVEVGEEYKLQQETLHLSVNYIDRFLAHVPVVRSKLQLVGVGCMLVASKYEDLSPPTVEDLVYISDHTYTRDEVLKMEGAVLLRLNFDLSVVTAVAFLSRYTGAAISSCACDGTVVPLSHFLVELSLQDSNFARWRPSEIAASGVRLALHTLRLPAWTAELEEVTGYRTADLTECVAELHAVFVASESSPLQAIREKYAHRNFLCVSTFKPQPAAPR